MDDLFLTTRPQEEDFLNHTEIVLEYNYYDYFPLSYRVLATVIHSLIFVFGVVGNVILILVVRRTRNLQSPTFVYLVSLAFADLIVLISAVPEAIVVHHIGRRWLLGQAGCSLFIFFNFLGINAGSLSILAFTLEQYIAVCGRYSRRFRMSDRTTKYVWGLWIFSILYCSPWFGLTEVQPDVYEPEQMQCELRLSREVYIGVFAADLILFYVLPLAVAVVVYSKIAWVLMKAVRYCSRDSPCLSLSGMDNSSSQPGICGPVGGFPGEKSGMIKPTYSASVIYNALLTSERSTILDEKREWVLQSRAQVIRMLVVIVVLFAAAWLPFRGLLVYNAFASDPWLDIWYVLFAKTFIYANSAMNPYLFNIMSRRYRMAVYRMLFGGPKKHRKQRQQRPHPHNEFKNSQTRFYFEKNKKFDTV
ncbi:putative Thyrotropin-releasing hormone receptor [Hypsibius exemplaris]|uniref:Thyrotropin-releasing hormone receptor n=1 Tax=Hypsibius exemplaris TaxID=2072580 RepID=A0A9X6RJD5_HYPEX|nr:putative Thyrotropin-releasing hormone receptor [Hypsibius exemplaris]